MKDVDHESTAQLLRSVLALGRRLRAARVPGTRALTGLTILGTLYRLGPMFASQLAAEEGLQPQSLTRLLAELERKQLISRKRSDTDGRAQTITLTALGRRRLLDEIGARRAWLKTAMAAALTPDERDIAKSASAVLLKIATHQAIDGPSFSTSIPKKSGPAFADENLAGASYRNVKLEKAVFNNVNLRSAVFENVNLSDATFANVNFSNVSIRDANVDGMTINGSHRGAVAAASSSTVFHVSSLSKSLDFYSRVLGFAIEFRHGAPETYAGLSWRGVHLHLSSAYPYKNNTGHGNIYIFCGEVDRLYEELDSAGVEFYSRIHDREYRMRDFAIKDLDGNQIGFGAPVA
jgi:DNA-binding MarR family transcriptional regulator/catechol 2,3-dioxygenase-like lactoylglutathione lyase family enzyme